MSPLRNQVQIKMNQTASLPLQRNEVVYNPYTKSYLPKGIKHKNIKTHTQLKFHTKSDNPNSWIGDPLEVPAKRQITRFWFHNCNGMTTAHDHIRFQHEISSYISNDIHFISLAETRINVCNKLTSFQIENSMSQLLPNSKIFLHNTPGYNNTTNYQPGGVASAFYGRLQQRYVTTTRDPYGRWISNIFKGSKHTLRVYTLYRVNPKTRKADISAWSQQKRALQLDNIDEDPRKHVVDSIIEDVKKHITNGDFIMIFADLNEPVISREKTNDKLLQVGLINVLQKRLQTNELPNTHRRGSKAIDHIWLSASLSNSVHKCGYSPFDFIGNSDHRGLYIDLHLTELLDANIYNIQPFKHRRLKSTIPKRVAQYLELVDKKWADQNIDTRYDRAVMLLREKKMAEFEIELNKIDKSISEILRHAEKKCCKLPNQNLLQWSPELRDALDLLRECRLLRTKTQYIQPKQSISEASHNYKSACHAYDEALQQYRNVKSKHVELRKTHMQNRAIDLAEQKLTDEAVELKKLINIEQMRRTHLKCNYVLKPTFRDGVQSILIPSACEYDDDNIDHKSVENMWKIIVPKNGKNIKSWDRITDRETVESMLLEWQQLHFLQANETPLATPEWKTRLDDPDFHNAVMNGKYIPPDNLPDEAKDVFKHMQRQPNIEDLHFSSTYEDFKSFIKNSKEKTSVSPSGRSYSHYKALMKGDKKYLQTIHAIIELCTTHQIILQRW